ncbi:hypothetical protein ACIBJC_33405 [Streptomyces sp. NPDC050509]|uniref:hypothetical protein n=1 Tax=Streptomyces sp. NPDC050509 TaxID=3365620 RepID=UPI00379CE562
MTRARATSAVRAWLTAKREAGAMWWAFRGQFSGPVRLFSRRRRSLWREARALYADPVYGPSERELLRRRIALWRHREAMRAELDAVRSELIQAELRALDEPALFQRIFGTRPPSH